jgi:hypothetical protein
LNFTEEKQGNKNDAVPVGSQKETIMIRGFLSTVATRHRALVAAGLLAAVFAAGCETGPSRQDRMPNGYIYYCDGAGGGGVIGNWAGGVRDGLQKAGYDGAGEIFGWNTGLGVVADQTSGNDYKRKKAGELAAEMKKYRSEYPNAPITLMGLSAGTAIAAFTLEALPPDVMVEDVFLLSGSLSSAHDLTRALQRINDKMYITTSARDGVLTVLVPNAGTADRDSGTTATVGVQGPRIPAGASPETRRLYREKIVMMPWKAEFAKYGNNGGHIDTVNARWIEHYIAPLVKTKTGKKFAAEKVSAPSGKVPNSTYDRWAKFGVGSYLLAEGTRTMEGRTERVRVKVTLKKKTARSMILEREFTSLDQPGQSLDLPAVLFESRFVDPHAQPLTHPNTKVKDLAPVTQEIAGKSMKCKARSVTTRGDFTAWGHNPSATLLLNDQIPGHIAAIKLKTQIDGRNVQYDVKTVKFNVAPAK